MSSFPRSQRSSYITCFSLNIVLPFKFRSSVLQEPSSNAGIMGSISSFFLCVMNQLSPRVFVPLLSGFCSHHCLKTPHLQRIIGLLILLIHGFKKRKNLHSSCPLSSTGRFGPFPLLAALCARPFQTYYSCLPFPPSSFPPLSSLGLCGLTFSCSS